MKLSRLFFPPPFHARHFKRTFVASPDDESSKPSRAVIECVLGVVKQTLEVDITDVCKRMPPADWNPEQWPGEHYRLLAGLVAYLQPKLVVEVGTETGLSALCMTKYLPRDGQLVTFDLIPWHEFSNSCLVPDDFSDGRLKQELADLSNPMTFDKYASLLSAADLIFLDGPKDGRFEPVVLAQLETLDFEKAPYVLFDDIRDRNMLRFWRELRHPKLDISSFGHWTGTGLVEWDISRNKKHGKRA